MRSVVLRLRLAVVFVAAAYSVQAGWVGAAGQAAPSSADLLDFVLVLDESGSMRTNDAEKGRVAAAQLFVDLPLPEDRLAVIAFGDGARVVAPLEPVGSGRQKILDGLGTIGGEDPRRDASSGRYSMVREALQLARDILGARTQKRRAAVVVLTDGEFEEDDIPVGVPLDEYLAATYLEAETLLADGTITVSLGFTRAANLDVLQRIARRGGGFTERVDRPEQTSSAFFRILRNLVPSQGQAFPESETELEFEVEPATWKVAVLAFKQTAGGPPIPISVERVGGGAVTGSTRDAKQYTLFEMLAPSAGTYVARVPLEGRMSVHVFRRNNITLSVRRPVPGSRLVPSTEVLPIELELTGARAGAVIGSWLSPDGEIAVIQTQATESGRGRQTWTGSVIPTVEGAHHIDFAALDTMGGSTIANTVLEFRAIPASVADLTIEPGSPVSGTPIRLHVRGPAIDNLSSVAARIILPSGDTVSVMGPTSTSEAQDGQVYVFGDTEAPGFYRASLRAEYSVGDEQLVQEAERRVAKTIEILAPAQTAVKADGSAEAHLRLINHGPTAQLALQPCSSADVEVVLPEGLVTLEPGRETDVTLLVTAGSSAELPATIVCTAQATIEGTEVELPLDVQVDLDVLTAAEVVLWAGLVLLGIVIVLMLLCRVRPRFSDNLVLFVESTGQEHNLADYRKRCSRRLYANRDVWLDDALGPKSLALNAEAGEMIRVVVKDEVSGLEVKGESLGPTDTRRVGPGDVIVIGNRRITIRRTNVIQ